MPPYSPISGQSFITTVFALSALTGTGCKSDEQRTEGLARGIPAVTSMDAFTCPPSQAPQVSDLRGIELNRHQTLVTYRDQGRAVDLDPQDRQDRPEYFLNVPVGQVEVVLMGGLSTVLQDRAWELAGGLPIRPQPATPCEVERATSFFQFGTQFAEAEIQGFKTTLATTVDLRLSLENLYRMRLTYQDGQGRDRQAVCSFGRPRDPDGHVTPRLAQVAFDASGIQIVIQRDPDLASLEPSLLRSYESLAADLINLHPRPQGPRHLNF